MVLCCSARGRLPSGVRMSDGQRFSSIGKPGPLSLRQRGVSGVVGGGFGLAGTWAALSVAHALTAEGIAAARGGRWARGTVLAVLRSVSRSDEGS